MLKVITLLTKFILVAITALLLASCNHSINWNSIEGSGNVTTERRNVAGDFRSIEVSNSIDVVIEQSDAIEIVVEADDNLLKHILTKVENGKLVISCDKNSFINMKAMKVTVKMPAIEQLEANSSASITSTNTIKGENITLSTASAGTINLSIELNDITCNSSSGSSMTIDGMALRMKANAASGSEIDTKNLLANEVNAKASSGATISTHAIVSLDAEASSGGNISYSKNPKSIRKESNSGGSISKE
jgi:hypothetical protein